MKARICRQLDALWNLGDLLAADEIYAADFLAHSPAGPPIRRGAAGEQARVVAVRTALTDVQLVLEDAVTEGDRLAIRWALRGLDPGVPGSGGTAQVVTVAGMTLFRLAGGHVVEAWESIDVLEQLAEARVPVTAG
ncbi:MAG TPA: ester cyclase [Chloroflexia bacterium]|nr:ester cyclase [Chloroflexia bacterium]